MLISECVASDFEGMEGTVFDVFLDGTPVFRMKLLEVKLCKPLVLPKWKPIGNLRKQPFSLFFESDRKMLVYGGTVVSGGPFEAAPLKLEPLDETAGGMIFQACFN